MQCSKNVHEALAFGCREGNISLVARCRSDTLVEHKRKFGSFEFHRHFWTCNDLANGAGQRLFRPHHHIGRPASQLALWDPQWLIHFFCWTTKLKVQLGLLPRSLKTQLFNIHLSLNNFTRIQAKGSATTHRVWRIISDVLKHNNQRCTNYKSWRVTLVVNKNFQGDCNSSLTTGW